MHARPVVLHQAERNYDSGFKLFVHNLISQNKKWNMLLAEISLKEKDNFLDINISFTFMSFIELVFWIDEIIELVPYFILCGIIQ